MLAKAGVRNTAVLETACMWYQHLSGAFALLTPTGRSSLGKLNPEKPPDAALFLKALLGLEM